MKSVHLQSTRYKQPLHKFKLLRRSDKNSHVDVEKWFKHKFGPDFLFDHRWSGNGTGPTHCTRNYLHNLTGSNNQKMSKPFVKINEWLTSVGWEGDVEFFGYEFENAAMEFKLIF